MIKYSFYDRLEHYMERELIKEENRKSVELAIMVEGIYCVSMRVS